MEMTMLDSMGKQQFIIWNEGFSTYKNDPKCKCQYDFGSLKFEQWMPSNTEAFALPF
jgi:hypothetical protein